MTDETFIDGEDEDDQIDEDPQPFDQETTETQTWPEEPLFAALLRKSVAAIHPNHSVLHDFVDHVVPHLSAYLAHKTAKGGNFVVQQRAKGIVDEAKIERYSRDQSLRAHLINGLFPTLHIAERLYDWDVPRFVDYFDDATRRLFCAGYVLHDWLKLPQVDQQLAQLGLDHASVNPAQHLAVIEPIFDRWCEQLGLHAFLRPLGEPAEYLHDLIAIASNTQIQWGTMHNLAQLPLLSRTYEKQRRLATELSTLADYVAYLGRTPVEVVQDHAIANQLQYLSKGNARLVYHHTVEVRGMLTNMINTTVQSLYAVADQREALLFAPTGTVYLERQPHSAAAPSIETIADRVVEAVKAACRDLLSDQLQGFKRDGKGLKYAPFYDLFFTPQQLTPLIAKAAFERLQGRKSSAATRYEKMVDVGMLAAEQLAELPTEFEWTIDMLAEGLALLEKELRDHAPGVDGVTWILEQLQAPELAAETTAIPQRANTGGVPYQWYYVAGVLHKHHSHRDPNQWHEVLETITSNAQQLLDASYSSTKFEALRSYIHANVRFSHTEPDSAGLRKQVQHELKHYSGAHKARQSTKVCSLCSSSYPIEPQIETAVLFAPMVYSNKQALHSSKATRHMCTICELEMMLRVLLMNQTAATGKNFEGRQLRYLFFYPTYFWTPETLRGFAILQTALRSLYPPTLRKRLINQETPTPQLYFEPDALQRLEDLLLEAPELRDRKDRWLRYTSEHAGAFGFLGIPPYGRDAKDAEAWIQPSLLALLMPLLIDVKVVASESMLPLLNEATELPETVLLDAPHQSIARLVEQTRLNLDQVLPALQRILVACFIHLDVYAKPQDARWHMLPALARDLSESSLHIFSALKRWQRRNGMDSMSVYKAALYLQYHTYFQHRDADDLPTADTEASDTDKLRQPVNKKGRLSMSHARTLVELYRSFYRAERLKTNAILRPIALAAEVILEARPSLFNAQAEEGAALIEVVRGRLQTFIRNVARNSADGRLPKGSTAESREQAISDFSAYFVRDIFLQALNGDPAALRGKQLNLLKNACEVLYIDAWRQERADQRVEDSNEDEE